MSDLLPLFPLPSSVLFPNVFLPLHVFEPRYRDMVADALASDRLVGVALLCPGWERDYEGRPPVYPIGCGGVITHVEPLTDGCYNIVLRGLQRYRIVDELESHRYRQAIVDWIEEPEIAGDDRDVIRDKRLRLETLLALAGERGVARARTTEARIPAAMADEDLVNALAQHLDFEPLEKQALLERHSLRTRVESLVELLEMKAMAARHPWWRPHAH
jgi:Lon protease-like protein